MNYPAQPVIDIPQPVPLLGATDSSTQYYAHGYQTVPASSLDIPRATCKLSEKSQHTIMELLQKLNEKADNTTTRLLFLERKVRKLKKEVQLLRMGKRTEEKVEESEEEEKEDEEESEKDDQEGNESEDAEQKIGEDDSSTTDSDAPSLIHKTSHKYVL
ncbi:uncharacterized protein LOC130768954 [Actinidia eriantha]|uniref:uncharacterized protein LOC130768954 n=1 Tax=Actinidia eriantha TaxID=165200 RepID=UPI0025892E48|nr:uncharacterized protein LOC130768954 [Actinidia eriantha]